MGGREENLIPANRRTAEELREMGAKGGRASGEARRRRKPTKDAIRQLLGAKVKMTGKLRAALGELGYQFDDGDGPTMELAALVNIANAAMKGDDDIAYKAMGFLYDYAQVPDMRAVLDRERVKAQAQARTRLDLTLTDDKAEALKAEVRARLMDDALGIASAEAQTPAGTTA